MEIFYLVSGLITFIAAVHYMYMRDAHAAGDSTTIFRYVDWIFNCTSYVR